MLKPTRVEMTADAWRVHLESSPATDGDPLRLRYRPDGWPLCPNCGEDELASRASLGGRLKLRDGSLRRAMPTDEMLCYRCQWNGAVPRREEAQRWGLLS